jgi:hypothetical protein
MKKQNGITLIALIITIIVMVILVAVTVNVAINGGLFGKTKEATSKYTGAQIKDKAEAIKSELMIDMYTEDITVAKQDLKEKLREKLGGDIQGDKVIVSDGKYEINVKNADLELAVTEYKGYVNTNSIITPKITTSNKTDVDVEVELELMKNITSETEYRDLRCKEAAEKAAETTTDEEKKETVLEFLQANGASEVMTVNLAETTSASITEINSIDDYFLMQVNAMLTENELPTCTSLENAAANQYVRAYFRIGENDNFTKGHLYNYFLNGNISQELTEKQVIEKFYYQIIQIQNNGNYISEYRNSTSNLTLKVNKDRGEYTTKTFASLSSGDKHSFTIAGNGVYEIFIIDESGKIVQEEKIVVNNLKEIENAISKADANNIWETNGDGKITKYSGKESNVKIPAYIGGEKIISIGQQAFYSCNITKITIPNTVTSIERAAFKYCRNLTDITIPNSVTFIDHGVFSSSGVKNIYFIKGDNELPANSPWGANDATVTEIDPPTAQ